MNYILPKKDYVVYNIVTPVKKKNRCTLLKNKIK